MALVLQSELSIEVLRTKLQRFLSEMEECYSIQDSSSRFLAYEINDMLDFSQLKQGKFRKNVTAFDTRASIDEIVKI